MTAQAAEEAAKVRAERERAAAGNQEGAPVQPDGVLPDPEERIPEAPLPPAEAPAEAPAEPAPAE
jgi:hypothetical protein